MRTVTEIPEIGTARLRLRGWRSEHLAPFAAMNADPAVMRHLGGPQTRRASDLAVGRFLEKWAEEPRFGWWAVEDRATGRFLGLAGLGTPDFDCPPAPCVEIGWRFVPDAWGQGLATEAALACLAHGFATVGLAEIVAFALPENRRSLAVMARIGMVEDPGAAFEHPLVERGPRRHLVHRRRRAAWKAGQDG